jgi:hypothetical protein
MTFRDLMILSEAKKVTLEQIEKWAEKNDADWDPENQILTIYGPDLDIYVMGVPVSEINLKYKNGKLKIIDLDDTIADTYEVWIAHSRDKWEDLYDEKTFFKETNLDRVIKDIASTRV